MTNANPERLKRLRFASSLLQSAKACEKRGYCLGAEIAERTALRVAQEGGLSELGDIPGLKTMTQDLSQTAMGKSMGITPYVQNSYAGGGGADTPLYSPQFHEGDKAGSDDFVEQVLGWYDRPDVQQWMGNLGETQKRQYQQYEDWMRNYGKQWASGNRPRPVQAPPAVPQRTEGYPAAAQPTTQAAPAPSPYPVP